MTYGIRIQPKSKDNIFVLRYLLLSILTIPLAGCWLAGSSKPVYIGHVFPPTSENGRVGQEQKLGIGLALKEVTDDPKTNETEIQQSERGLDRPAVVVHVDATNSTKAAYEAAAVRLSVVNEVVGFVGGQTAAEVRGLDQEGRPVVSMAGLKTPEMSNRVFLVGLPPDFRGKCLADVAARSIKHTPQSLDVKAALPAVGLGWPGVLALAHKHSQRDPKPPTFVLLVDRTQPEFERTAEAFARELDKNLGKKFRGQSIPEPTRLVYASDEELNAQLDRLRKVKPDAVLVAGDADVVLKIRTTASGKSLPIVFGGLEGAQGKLLADRRTDDKVYLITAWTADHDAESNQEFVKRFREAYDRKPDVNAALAYECARILFTAMRETKSSFTSEAIKKKLSGLETVPNLTGAIKFDGQQVLLRPGFAIELRQGKVARLQKYQRE